MTAYDQTGLEELAYTYAEYADQWSHRDRADKAATASLAGKVLMAGMANISLNNLGPEYYMQIYTSLAIDIGGEDGFKKLDEVREFVTDNPQVWRREYGNPKEVFGPVSE